MAIPYNLPKRNYIKAFWKLDEESGNRVDETGNHLATDVNTVLFDTGHINNAAKFARATEECFTLVDHTDLKPTTPFSAGCWFKSNSRGGTQIIFSSYSAHDADRGGFEIYSDTSDHFGILSGRGTGGVHGTDFNDVSGTTDIVDNNLHQLMATWDGSDLKVYVDDGVAEGTQAWAHAPSYGDPNYVRIGCDNVTGANRNFTNGLIDELILWNGVALTQAEVLQVKNITTYAYAGGFSGFSPWIFMKDMWEKHNKIWTPKGLILPKEGYSYLR